MLGNKSNVSPHESPAGEAGKTVLLCITILVLVLSLTDVHADDRAKQRAESRIFTQMEKYEAWQEEVDSELDELMRQAGNYRRTRGNEAAEARAWQHYLAQDHAVDISQSKGSRILSRIRRACQQMAERWPPESFACQEEFPELVRFHRRTSTRRGEAYDYAAGR